MDTFGINSRFLLIQLFNCGFLLAWIGLSLYALVGLKKKKLAETARVLWVFLIIVVPVLGAAAFWIVQPGELESSE